MEEECQGERSSYELRIKKRKVMNPVRSRDRNLKTNKIMKINYQKINSLTLEISELIAIYF